MDNIVYQQASFPVTQINLAASFSFKGRDASNGSSQNESMDIMGALISVNRLQVHDMPNDMILVTDAVST